MSENNKHRHWLFEQLPILVKRGLISREQASDIRSYYGEVRPGTNLAMVVVAILGVLLVGGGIILIVAYNWDQLSRFWRTVISFAPLVLGQLIYIYAFFRRPNEPAWQEGASTFLMLMLAATIALVSQTYHITGSRASFLLTWLLLSLPLLYLRKATVVAILYLAGSAVWAVEQTGNSAVGYWALLAAVGPYFYQVFRSSPEDSLRPSLLGWALGLTVFFAWFGVVEMDIYAYSFLGTPMLLANYYMHGHNLFGDNPRIFNRPLRTLSVVGVYLFLLALTFRFKLPQVDFEHLVNGLHYDPWAARINLLILLGLTIRFIFLFLSGFPGRSHVGNAVTAAPFIGLFYLILYFSGAESWARLLANAGAFALGVAFLEAGLRQERLSLVNIGMLFILFLIGLRFFDAEWSYIIKGVAFVVLGLSFLGVNIILGRRHKTGQKEQGI